MPIQYMQNILSRETPILGAYSPASMAANVITPVIRSWGGDQIDFLGLSGSYAKGTAIKGGTDVDLFISLKYGLDMSLADIYQSLFQYVYNSGYVTARKQNVSIGITVNGMNVDLVPAKQQNIINDDHSLFRRKANIWTKTNVNKHIQVISQSGRLTEIRIMKIWRNQKRLDFPSFYLELCIIEALRNYPYLSSGGDLTENIRRVLTYLNTTFKTAQIVDPANTNNIISDDLTQTEKSVIALAAQRSLAGNWGEFIS